MICGGLYNENIFFHDTIGALIAAPLDDDMTDSPSAEALARYYAARAPEYERFYAKPEYQADLARLRERVIPDAFAGRQRLVDVACGTGYWLPILARAVRSVQAVDIGIEVLDLAREKLPGCDPESDVTFSRADALALPDALGVFDAAFLGFFWSHVSRARIPELLSSLHARLAHGAVVLILDDLPAGSRDPIVLRDPETGDTYQRRCLSDGSEHRVMKNFPTEAELRRSLADHPVSSVTYDALEYHWTLRYVWQGP